MITAARLSTRHLSAIAGLRADTAVRVHIEGDSCWVRWPEERDDVLDAMRPVPSIEFYEFRKPHWYRAGSRLPSSLCPPDGNGEAVARWLYPGTFPIRPVDQTGVHRLPLTLERGGSAQSATSLACQFDALTAWGDSATTAELRSVRAAVSGSHAILLGSKLPAIVIAQRFWGTDIFIPVGFRIIPELPLPILKQAIGVSTDEFAFFDGDHIDIVPRSAFEPLTRAALRMAVQA